MSEKDKQQKSMKRLVFFAWCFIILMTVTSLFEGFGILFKRFHPESPAEQAKRLFVDPSKITKHIRINDIDLDIPVSYFDFMVPRETEDVTVLLNFMYPEMTPVTKSNKELREEGLHLYSFSYMIKDPRFFKEISVMAEFFLQNTHRTVMTGTEFGLEIYNPEEEKGSGRLVPRLYRENGQVKGIIMCSEKYVIGVENSDHREPWCTQYFLDQGLINIVSFPQKLLSQWREIKKKTVDMISGFHRAALDKGLHEKTISQDRVDIKLKEYRRKQLRVE